MKANLLIAANLDESASEEPGLQQQVQLSRELAFEQDMLIDREARIRQIEADVLDVNQIMRELSALVHEQGENVGKCFSVILTKFYFKKLFFRYN